MKFAATQSGKSSQAFGIGVLKDRLTRQTFSKPLKRLSIANLLEEINRGMSEEDWARYAKLIARRRKEALTRNELVELCEISERLEKLSARRMELVAELARRRGTELNTELRKLGIEPRHV